MKVKKKVRRFLSDTPLPEKKTYLEWVKVPEKEVWPTADVHVWNSKCGIYKVYRIQSRYRDDAPSYASTVKREVAGVPSFHMIESDVLGPGYPKKYKSLDLALTSVETHIAKSTKSLVDSNKQTILSCADRMQEEGEFDKKEKEGLSSGFTRPTMNLQSPVSESKRKGKTMEIVRDEAVLLLKELGYKVPDGASNKKLTSMLAKVEEGSPIEDNDKLQELYDAVLEAIQEESPPVVVNEEEEEEEEVKEKPKKKGKAEKSEKEKPEKAEKAEKKTKPEKAAKAEKNLDKFGMREGSGAAKINAVLSAKTPMTTKEIHEKCGVETPLSRIHGHMRKLAERGFVTKTDKGWLVKGQSKK